MQRVSDRLQLVTMLVPDGAAARLRPEHIGRNSNRYSEVVDPYEYGVTSSEVNVIQCNACSLSTDSDRETIAAAFIKNCFSRLFPGSQAQIQWHF